MPTQESWIGETIVQTVWHSPLKADELTCCFANLLQFIDESDKVIHVLFDITQAKQIPGQAPMLFIRSKITSRPNLGRMAVVGVNPLAQIFAQMAVKVTGRKIEFFRTRKDALAYLERC